MDAKTRNQLVDEIRSYTIKRENRGLSYEEELYYGKLLETAENNNICTW